ncbi:helix-turn-helix transcriptional regulator [Paraflavitalea pollutisoli]|uniref:helix-turn-helix transcriptional regulator n=1 Tax=Paraflavitalea pollutisoli TaxID=3034143 RepID=UPI0023EE13F7|nr:DNA-binding response regulator [Paraflavitalea sp. H1-2-19X]
MRSTILIVGPSRDLLHRLRDKLPVDYGVYVARTLAAGLSIVGSHAIQLVLLVPDGLADGGRSWCRSLKTGDGGEHRPVVMVTGVDGAEMRQRCLAAGADEHIGGAIFREHLDMLVRHLIANRLKEKRVMAHRVVVPAPAMSEQESLLQKLHACLRGHVFGKDLTVDRLALLMHMSRPTLYRKIKQVTHMTPNELINEIRLQQAAALLAAGNYKVFEVAQLLGYTSQSSFGKSFLKYYKVTPATYQRTKKMQDAA